MAEHNSAAMIASTLPTKVENLSIPGFGPASSGQGVDLNGYRVRYGKYDLDDVGALTELEIVETKGLRGDDIVVLTKDKFTFMDKYIMVVTYLEKIEPV